MGEKAKQAREKEKEKRNKEKERIKKKLKEKDSKKKSVYRQAGAKPDEWAQEEEYSQLKGNSGNGEDAKSKKSKNKMSKSGVSFGGEDNTDSKNLKKRASSRRFKDYEIPEETKESSDAGKSKSGKKSV